MLGRASATLRWGSVALAAIYGLAYAALLASGDSLARRVSVGSACESGDAERLVRAWREATRQPGEAPCLLVGCNGAFATRRHYQSLLGAHQRCGQSALARLEEDADADGERWCALAHAMSRARRMVRETARRDANVFARRLSLFLECGSWVACADVADDHYHRKYAPRFADACSPDVLARPPEAASCLPLCRTLLEAASSPRKAVDDLFSPANERAVRVALRVTGSVAAVAAFASMF